MSGARRSSNSLRSITTCVVPSRQAVVLLSDRLHPVPEITPPEQAELASRSFWAGRDPRSDGGRAEHRHQWVGRRDWPLVRLDAAPFEPPQDAPSRAGEDPGYVLGLGWWQWGEGAGLRRRARVDAVEHERVEVGREVERGAEALDSYSEASLPPRSARSLPNPEELASTATLMGKHRPQKGLQDLGGEPRVPRAAIAEWIGQGQHPLPDRDLGQHAVDEVGSGEEAKLPSGHAPSAAGRTESTTFAREGNEAIVAVSVASMADASGGGGRLNHSAPNLSLE